MLKITRVETVALANAITALSGRAVEASDGDKKVVIVKPYDIDGPTRYALAKNRRALKTTLTEIEDEQADLNTRFGLAKESSPKLEGEALTKARLEFQKAFSTFMRAEVEITEFRLKASDLKINTNQLDPTTIEGLLPILDGEV